MDVDTSTLALGALLVAGLVVVAVAANDALRRRTRIRRRMDPLAELLDATEASVVVPVREQVAEIAPFVAMLDSRYPLAGGVRTALVAAVAGLVAAFAFVPALTFVGMPVVYAVLLGLLLAFGFGWNVGTFLEQRKRVLFNDRFLIAVEDFQRMVRFGIATSQAFKSIAGSAEEPVQSSLQRVRLDADFGVPLGTALGREAHRVRISEMAMLAAILATQSRTGGGLSESVGNLAEMLRERIDNRSRIKAATSESKISLIILTGVPFAAIGIQGAMQPELVTTLLDQARHLLGIGVGMIATGLTVAWFLVRSAER